MRLDVREMLERIRMEVCMTLAGVISRGFCPINLIVGARWIKHAAVLFYTTLLHPAGVLWSGRYFLVGAFF